MKKIDIKDPKAIEMTVRVLKEGGIVMHPTETCYGLAVDVFNKQAVSKLLELKGRDAIKPISILVNNFEMASKFGKFSDKAKDLAEKYWPGALSIVVPRVDASLNGLPEYFNPGQKFVSIRCSSDNFCFSMVDKFWSPLTTTSANLTGNLPLYEADISIFDEMAFYIDLVVDGGKILMNKPSTIVKIEGDSIEVLRQGDLRLGI